MQDKNQNRTKLSEVNWHSRERIIFLLFLSFLALLSFSLGQGLYALIFFLFGNDETLVAVVLKVFAGPAAELLGALAANLIEKKYI